MCIVASFYPSKHHIYASQVCFSARPRPEYCSRQQKELKINDSGGSSKWMSRDFTADTAGMIHTHVLSRLLPPQSRKPLANGLLSIFSWVICKSTKRHVRATLPGRLSSWYLGRTQRVKYRSSDALLHHHWKILLTVYNNNNKRDQLFVSENLSSDSAF